jgi:hypothetical protein
MWTINSHDVFRLRTPGGDRFTKFVDALIRGEAYIQGVQLSQIATNQRTNLGDGGVDTEVCQAMPSSLTGWMNEPTCWQYKATEFRHIHESELRKEVNKPYSKALTQKGYGYRLCICDDLTPEKKKEWENILDDEVKKLNYLALPSKVITASDLAAWTSQFPAIIIDFFKPQLGQLLHLGAWGQNITKLTPTFVEIEVWASLKQSIIAHADFNCSCNDVIFPIQGEAGVGKTRLTYEALRSLEGSVSLVLYALDANSINIAYALANEQSVRAILVADECLLKTRMRLNDILTGHSNRVRVICLDNSGERPSTGEAEPWLVGIPEENVDSVLKHNFPTVPADRRRAYVKLSRGFVRFAAILCREDHQISVQGHIGSVLRNAKDYLLNRVSEEELIIMEAIALFHKVGVRDNVKEELDRLCEVLSLEQNKILQTANRLKDVPGFIAFAGRYLYVTPEVIAQALFELAWRRWAENDPQAFLLKIPHTLLESFLKRVSTSGSEEVRYVVGDFFRIWATSLQSMDLTDIDKVNRFVVLTDTNPGSYLSLLAKLVDSASKDELLKIAGGRRGGPRRPLVWLAERMARLPEFFSYAESILWNLALAESEHSLGNNATNIWQQLFQIFLPGTATPFAERIALLQRRLSTEDEQQISLALEGLSNALEIKDVSRIVGPPVIAGRIPPEQWQPKTQLELRQCIDLALDVLVQVAASVTPSLRNGALNVAIQHMRTFLLNGYLEQMKALFPVGAVSQDVLLSLIDTIENFIQFNSSVSLEVQEWVQNLIPDDFHGKLIKTLGKSPWHYSFQDDQEAWHQEILSLARQLCEQKELLKSEIDWLGSPQANGVWPLGNAMGLCDTNAVCLDIILDAVANTHDTGLAREYLGSLLRNHPQHSTAVNARLDQFEIHIPAVAYELFIVGGDATKSVERALKLIDAGTLPLDYFGGFISGTAQRALSAKEFYEILKRLTNSLKGEKNIPTIQTAIKLVAYRLKNDDRQNQVNVLEDTAIQDLIWDLLETTAKFYGGEAYHWDEILRIVAKLDVNKAVRIASLALISEDSQKETRAEQILVELAKPHAALVMQRVGEAILDEEYGWQFCIEKYRFLIQSIPFDAMKSWLHSTGAVGAQKIARGLPLPQLDENDKPVVAMLTRFVLSEFESDERTFQEFCMGSHSLQTYVGDMALHKEREAEIAKKFLDYPLRRVREWAEHEISSCEQEIKYWCQINEEGRIG